MNRYQFDKAVEYAMYGAGIVIGVALAVLLAGCVAYLAVEVWSAVLDQ